MDAQAMMAKMEAMKDCNAGAPNTQTPSGGAGVNHGSMGDYTPRSAAHSLANPTDASLTTPTAGAPPPSSAESPTKSTGFAMWKQFLGNMVPVITRVVKFCKRIPGL